MGAVPGAVPGVGSAPRSLPGVGAAPGAFPGVGAAPLSVQGGHTGARGSAGPHQPGHAGRGHCKESLSLTPRCTGLEGALPLISALTTLGGAFMAEQILFRVPSHAGIPPLLQACSQGDQITTLELVARAEGFKIF